MNRLMRGLCPSDKKDSASPYKLSDKKLIGKDISKICEYL